MSNETAIGWTDFSSNPIKYRDNETGKRVWACVKKSAGCTNCYSEALALRWNKGQAFSRPNIDQVEPFFDDAEARKLLSNRAIPSGSRVFVGDMTDIFGSWVPDALLDRLFDVFTTREDVTFQVLTKRPERMHAFARRGLHRHGARPLPNVWLGTSVEDQRAADERIPLLFGVPAAVRFLSCEPLLGPLNLDAYLWAILHNLTDDGWVSTICKGDDGIRRGSLGWVIVGGESGANHRPMSVFWLNDIVNQCQAAGVPVFTKQDSGLYPGRQGRIADDYWLHEYPRTEEMRRAGALPLFGGG